MTAVVGRKPNMNKPTDSERTETPAVAVQRFVRPRSKNTAFLLDRMPWDKEWTIRICLPGIDNGHAIWLESTFKRRSKKQALKMVSDIVKLMPTVREWPNIRS